MIMNLPNKLTCSRFGFSLLILLCVSVSFPYAKTLGLLLFVAAGVTDALDGWLARNKYGITDFGKLMDPLADKVLVTVALVCFVGYRFDLAYPNTALAPAFLVVPILVREFMVTGLRLLAVEKGTVISAGPLGKWKTGLQMAAIIFTLFAMAWVEDFLPDTADLVADSDAYHHKKSIEFVFHWIIWFLMTAAAVLTILSGVDYFKRHSTLFTAEIP